MTTKIIFVVGGIASKFNTFARLVIFLIVTGHNHLMVLDLFSFSPITVLFV